MTTKNPMVLCDVCKEPCKQPETAAQVWCKNFKRAEKSSHAS